MAGASVLMGCPIIFTKMVSLFVGYLILTRGFLLLQKLILPRISVNIVLNVGRNRGLMINALS